MPCPPHLHHSLPLGCVPSSLGWKPLPLEQSIAGIGGAGPREREESITGQPGRSHGASEDADALGQPLHLMILRWEGSTQLSISGQTRPGQRVLSHELLPACIITLVRDIPLAHLPLQLSKVQPRLVLLGTGEHELAGATCTEGSQ